MEPITPSNIYDRVQALAKDVGQPCDPKALLLPNGLQKELLDLRPSVSRMSTELQSLYSRIQTYVQEHEGLFPRESFSPGTAENLGVDLVRRFGLKQPEEFNHSYLEARQHLEDAGIPSKALDVLSTIVSRLVDFLASSMEFYCNHPGLTPPEKLQSFFTKDGQGRWTPTHTGQILISFLRRNSPFTKSFFQSELFAVLDVGYDWLLHPKTWPESLFDAEGTPAERAHIITNQLFDVLVQNPLQDRAKELLPVSTEQGLACIKELFEKSVLTFFQLLSKPPGSLAELPGSQPQAPSSPRPGSSAPSANPPSPLTGRTAAPSSSAPQMGWFEWGAVKLVGFFSASKEVERPIEPSQPLDETLLSQFEEFKDLADCLGSWFLEQMSSYFTELRPLYQMKKLAPAAPEDERKITFPVALGQVAAVVIRQVMQCDEEASIAAKKQEIHNNYVPHLSSKLLNAPSRLIENGFSSLIEALKDPEKCHEMGLTIFLEPAAAAVPVPPPVINELGKATLAVLTEENVGYLRQFLEKTFLNTLDWVLSYQKSGTTINYDKVFNLFKEIEERLFAVEEGKETRNLPKNAQETILWMLDQSFSAQNFLQQPSSSASAAAAAAPEGLGVYQKQMLLHAAFFGGTYLEKISPYVLVTEREVQEQRRLVQEQCHLSSEQAALPAAFIKDVLSYIKGSLNSPEDCRQSGLDFFLEKGKPLRFNQYGNFAKTFLSRDGYPEQAALVLEKVLLQLGGPMFARLQQGREEDFPFLIDTLLDGARDLFGGKEDAPEKSSQAVKTILERFFPEGVGVIKPLLMKAAWLATRFLQEKEGALDLGSLVAIEKQGEEPQAHGFVSSFLAAYPRWEKAAIESITPYAAPVLAYVAPKATNAIAKQKEEIIRILSRAGNGGQAKDIADYPGKCVREILSFAAQSLGDPSKCTDTPLERFTSKNGDAVVLNDRGNALFALLNDDENRERLSQVLETAALSLFGRALDKVKGEKDNPEFVLNTILGVANVLGGVVSDVNAPQPFNMAEDAAQVVSKVLDDLYPAGEDPLLDQAKPFIKEVTCMLAKESAEYFETNFSQLVSKLVWAILPPENPLPTWFARTKPTKGPRYSREEKLKKAVSTLVPTAWPLGGVVANAAANVFLYANHPFPDLLYTLIGLITPTEIARKLLSKPKPAETVTIKGARKRYLTAIKREIEWSFKSAKTFFQKIKLAFQWIYTAIACWIDPLIVDASIHLPGRKSLVEYVKWLAQAGLYVHKPPAGVVPRSPEQNIADYDGPDLDIDPNIVSHPQVDDEEGEL